MTSSVNRCMMRFRDRAERIDRAQIIETFVEVGRATDKFPDGLLFSNDNQSMELADVPEDDARSYRRAVLDLSEFYESQTIVEQSPIADAG